ncbi:ArsR/SmtB family transcription factor [Albidovulum sp.]|uniref:ArsR/SmtB family transcription factor n=1 Tax=Albidovulum sp. TaxID=1872424 RepID=UPI001D572360|nr:winged helix-turn-helix transcriptional regulator [Paracoccaceae bacterium]MCC0046158.1 winged helix-turn-helix transcriptional regulator [Defluviimonas sp.]HPE26660.1 metalloregulator ArsR/SmtB family transcription factor [Albidovulum sp.]MCB2121779.1 winged helix-turn-helix transcriptional regulator [Paracoccaceae bacterium]MCB2157183.1 winged helix-turn-helix transcriptional regulator [Paracoccaceae bacterium]
MNLSPGQLDILFQALGDPTRRAILQRLARGPATVTELAAPFDMALPSFLAHVRRLEASGLVETAKDGRTRKVTLVPGAFTPVRSWLDEQRALWEGRLDRLDDYVTRLMKDRANGPRPED